MRWVIGVIVFLMAGGGLGFAKLRTPAEPPAGEITAKTKLLRFLDKIEHCRIARHAVENNVRVCLQRGAHGEDTRPIKNRAVHAQMVKIALLLPHAISRALGQLKNAGNKDSRM